MIDWTATCRRVRQEIGQEARYRHSICVARTAELLAMAHGVDTRAARTAGIFHDLARLWSKKRLLEEARRRALPLDDFDLANPTVIHAPMSAELAAEHFGVRDTAVLDAIRKHTLGDATMTPLDVVIYLGDALEPGRAFEGRTEMLDLAMCDLTAGMRAVLRSTIAHNAARGYILSPKTLACARAFGLTVPKEQLHA